MKEIGWKSEKDKRECRKWSEATTDRPGWQTSHWPFATARERCISSSEARSNGVAHAIRMQKEKEKERMTHAVGRLAESKRTPFTGRARGRLWFVDARFWPDCGYPRSSGGDRRYSNRPIIRSETSIIYFGTILQFAGFDNGILDDYCRGLAGDVGR